MVFALLTDAFSPLVCSCCRASFCARPYEGECLWCRAHRLAGALPCCEPPFCSLASLRGDVRSPCTVRRQTLLLLHLITWRSFACVTGLETLPAERAEREDTCLTYVSVGRPPFHTLASLSLPLSASSILRMPLYAYQLCMLRHTSSQLDYACTMGESGSRAHLQTGSLLWFNSKGQARLRLRSFQRQTWAWN